MRYARHVAMLLGAAGIAMIAMSGDRTYSQGNGPNAYPNPYQLQENWAKLPPGRTWGSSIGVEIDPGSQNFEVFTRSGNVEQPARGRNDWGWSAWQPLKDGAVASPAGRFLCVRRSRIVSS